MSSWVVKEEFVPARGGAHTRGEIGEIADHLHARFAEDSCAADHGPDRLVVSAKFDADTEEEANEWPARCCSTR